MSALSGRAAIRTQAGIVDARRSRSPQGALLEMAILEMERQRLCAESDRLRRRSEQIAQRTAEIDRRQQRLQRFVERRAPDVEARPAPLPPARPVPQHRSRKLGY